MEQYHRGMHGVRAYLMMCDAQPFVDQVSSDEGTWTKRNKYETISDGVVIFTFVRQVLDSYSYID